MKTCNRGINYILAPKAQCSPYVRVICEYGRQYITKHVEYQSQISSPKVTHHLDVCPNPKTSCKYFLGLEKKSMYMYVDSLA